MKIIEREIQETNEERQHNVMRMSRSRFCCIRVYADSIIWMDCIFLVDRKDEEKACTVLSKAYDDFWDDDSNHSCYGDFFEGRLTEAGIEFESFYTNDDDNFGNEEENG